MLPNAALPKTPFGAPYAGAFSALKTSPLRSSRPRFPSATSRTTARSSRRTPGPRTGCREAEPSVKAGASAKASVRNHRAAVRCPAGSAGSPTRCGRCTLNPANAFRLVACVTATGSPDCSVSTPDTVQSCPIQPRHPGHRCRRPLPIGTAHTPEATSTCGMSPADTSRSRRRLFFNDTAATESGPVRIEASNTDEASSVRRDQV